MYAFVLLYVFSIQRVCLHCMKLLKHDRLLSVMSSCVKFSRDTQNKVLELGESFGLKAVSNF